MKLRIYGNWCDLGYGDGPCLDAIDCACYDHNVAYAAATAIEDGLSCSPSARRLLNRPRVCVGASSRVLAIESGSVAQWCPSGTVRCPSPGTQNAG
jgi:hypothetical protein